MARKINENIMLLFFESKSLITTIYTCNENMPLFSKFINIFGKLL